MIPVPTSLKVFGSATVPKTLFKMNLIAFSFIRKEGNVLFTDAFNTFYLHLYGRKEGNVLFNDTLNTFNLRLYGIRHMVKYHTDSERVNPLPPHGLLFLTNSKGSFICTITQTGLHKPRPLLHQSWSTGWNKKQLNGSTP